MLTHRLAELHERHSLLKNQLQEVEQEIFKVLQEINDSERSVINALSTRGRTALYRWGIETNEELYWFLEGTNKYQDFFKNYAKNHFKGDMTRLSSRINRLMIIRGIGLTVAEEILRIAKEKKLIE